MKILESQYAKQIVNNVQREESIKNRRHRVTARRLEYGGNGRKKSGVLASLEKFVIIYVPSAVCRVSRTQAQEEGQHKKRNLKWNSQTQTL